MQDDALNDDYSRITLSATFSNDGFATVNWKTDKSDSEGDWLDGEESEYLFKAYIKGHRDKTSDSKNKLSVY